MKKIFLISLLLISAFLIGSAGVAWAPPPPCIDYQDYACTYSYSEEGMTDVVDTDCLTMCYDNGFEVVVYGDCYTCYLYPVTGSRYLLGTANTCGGWAGCSVERRARSLTTKVTFIEYNMVVPGLEYTNKCIPCNDCCH